MAADAAVLMLATRMLALLENRAARRRAAIAADARAMGVEAAIQGEAVRLSGPGIVARWWRDLALREAGRSGR
jgi:hypothetical protein